MIDLSGKPSFPADQCPTCAERRTIRAENLAEWQRQVAACESQAEADKLGPFLTPCDRCKQPIPPYLHVPAGYEAQTIDHWHLISTGGQHSFRMVRDTVCLDCYREDWKAVYPDVPLPV